MSRSDSRRDYRHFPPEYAELVRQYDRTGRADIGPMSQKEARAAARDLYRFKMFLTAACDSDTDDPYARELLDAFTSASIHVEPVATHDPRGTHCVAFVMNPIVAAVRATRNQTRIDPQTCPSCRRTFI